MTRSILPQQKGIPSLRHATHIKINGGSGLTGSNLVSCAGPAPVLQLAERAGVQQLFAHHVKIDKPGGVNAQLRARPALVAGMIAGADSIDDLADQVCVPKGAAWQS